LKSTHNFTCTLTNFICRKKGLDFINAGIFVGVIALDYNGTVPLLKRHRPVVDDYVFEIPCAQLNTGTIIANNNSNAIHEYAKQVLKEQTGLVAHEITPLCEFWMEPSHSNQRVLVYRASKLEDNNTIVRKNCQQVPVVTLFFGNRKLLTRHPKQLYILFH